MRVRVIGGAACAAIVAAACGVDFASSGGFAECDADGQCASGSTCATHPTFGRVCLTDDEFAKLCGHAEACNGRDDDCDGVTDEEFVDLGSACDVGVGACAASGMVICASDGLGTTCGATSFPPGSETCNLLDDDCDGQTDEGVADAVSGTDEGECAVRVESCVTGVFVPINAGTVPTDETCNLLDDDCDGMTDEGVPAIISGSAIGECRNTIAVCDGGAPIIIQQGTDPTDERCNGRDDDCDGVTDEEFVDLGSACDVGVGACAASGMVICASDGLGTTCGATSFPPGSETCNLLDDDCDGQTDEEFPELGTACSAGVGSCRAEGVRTCTANQLGTACDATPRDPEAEACNGLDDDCDGRIDWIGDDCCVPDMARACGIALGQCTVGEQRCLPGRSWTACSGQAATPEVCDEIDNDCNGAIDNGIPCACIPERRQSCSVDRGQCHAGEQVCGADATWGECSGQLPASETCNLLDDDCDGSTDEDWPERDAPCTVGRGACSRNGTFQCTEAGDALACSAVSGPASDETCNLLDDDCDGETDENITVRRGTDTGACQEGIERCVGGSLTTVQVEVGSSVETCNGIDDDCDGAADEDAPNCCDPGPPAATRTCGFNRGQCTIGVQRCEADRSWGECNGTLPVEEFCNDLDDDCDGLTDEAWVPRLGRECRAGTGVCARIDVARCADDGSDAVCPVDPGAPAIETCNRLDDDCDGETDEFADLPTEVTGTDTGECRPRIRACRNGEMAPVQTAIEPIDERCNGLDDDCDGVVDNAYRSRTCYEGPFDAENVGVCVAGNTVCIDGREICAGQVLPSYEICNGLDDDCDGVEDGSPDLEGNPIPLEQECYTGAAGTADVGECRAGTVACRNGRWGRCVGDVLPTTADACGDALDNDCDGATDNVAFLEDFEDNCAMPEAIVTSDVPLDCVETPMDAEDPSRTPVGNRSLRVALAQVDVNIQGVLEWRFSMCTPVAHGGVRLFLQRLSPNTGVFIQPEFAGQVPAFLVQEWDRRYVQVVHADGSFTDHVQPSMIPLGEWHDVTWMYDANGRLSFALDGTSFFDEPITATVEGIYLRCGLAAPEARISILFDDVRFSSP